MRDVAVIGVGMHPFGKFLEKSLKDLARVAVWEAIKDSGVNPKEIEVAYVANALAGLITGQEGVRGQLVLRDAGLGGIPIINVENACASASTALRGAYLEIASGNAEVAHPNLGLNGVGLVDHDDPARRGDVRGRVPASDQGRALGLGGRPRHGGSRRGREDGRLSGRHVRRDGAARGRGTAP